MSDLKGYIGAIASGRKLSFEEARDAFAERIVGALQLRGAGPRQASE